MRTKRQCCGPVFWSSVPVQCSMNSTLFLLNCGSTINRILLSATLEWSLPGRLRSVILWIQKCEYKFDFVGSAMTENTHLKHTEEFL